MTEYTIKGGHIAKNGKVIYAEEILKDLNRLANLEMIIEQDMIDDMTTAEVKCQLFMSDPALTSATICRFCGKEFSEH